MANQQPKRRSYSNWHKRLAPERWDELEERLERERRERDEAQRLHETELGRWGDHASPARMRRDIQRDREEDEKHA